MAFGDGAKNRARRYGLAFFHGDLGDDSACGRVHFERDLIGLKFGNGFVGLDRIACLLEPLANGSFGDGLTQRGNNDFDSHLHSLR